MKGSAIREPIVGHSKNRVLQRGIHAPEVYLTTDERQRLKVEWEKQIAQKFLQNDAIYAKYTNYKLEGQYIV